MSLTFSSGRKNRFVIWKGDHLTRLPSKCIVRLVGNAELTSEEKYWGALARMCLLGDRMGQAEEGGLLFVSSLTNHECIEVMQYLMNGGMDVVCMPTCKVELLQSF